jgi:hypothetical protein
LSRLKMTRSATVKVFMLLIRLAAIAAMFTFVQVAFAQEILLAASQPQTMHFTTNGADPLVTPPSAGAPATQKAKPTGGVERNKQRLPKVKSIRTADPNGIQKTFEVDETGKVRGLKE